MKSKIQFVVQAARWRDKVNGNTYHACRITRTRDGAMLCCPLRYGYGDHYRATALREMAAAKWLPPKYRETGPQAGAPYWRYESENDMPILWIVTDGLKRDAVALGRE